LKSLRISSTGTRLLGPLPFAKPVLGITRFGAESFHFWTVAGSPKTTAATFSQSISAMTFFLYSPLAAG
jgi:hypothetical protein